MSGAHSLYRTASRPLFIGGQPVFKQPTGPTDWHAIRRTIRPVPEQRTRFNKDITEWTLQIELRQVHVLDYVEPEIRPSKHARGRMRSRTKTEQRRYRALYRKYVQMAKSQTVDTNRLRALHDELALG